MRILLLGEYSNVHATLADGLRGLGQEVTVISNGDFWKNYERDIDLSRRPGKWGGIRYVARLMRMLPKMRDYDVVQVINPMFLEIKAERILPVYKYLRRHNRKMFMGAFGMDYYWVNTCTTRMPLRYSDFNIGNAPRHTPDADREYKDWVGTAKEELNRYIAEDCDGIVTGLYEYHVCYQPCFPEKTRYIPFPIEKKAAVPAALRWKDPEGKIRFFLGINGKRSAYKGTDVMLSAVRRLEARYPDRVRLQVVDSLPFDTYREVMRRHDVLLDQLYSYTPAMNGLEAMSQGLVCVGGGEEEAYGLVGETELRPIVNVLPDEEDVYGKLEQLALHPERVPLLQQQSIDFVDKYHDHQRVALQYLDFWKNL